MSARRDPAKATGLIGITAVAVVTALVALSVLVAQGVGALAAPAVPVTPAAAAASAGATSAWSIEPSPNLDGATSSSLSSVSCSSATTCVAVGTGFAASGTGAEVEVPLTLALNGTTWVQTPNPFGSSAGLRTVSCPTTTWCVAVGSRAGPTPQGLPQPLLVTWNGGTWSVVPLPVTTPTNGTLTSVSCPTTGFCMATGGAIGGPTSIVTPPLAIEWSGTVWTDHSPTLGTKTGDSFADLSSVSCVATHTCMAVGATGGPHVSGHGLQEWWNGSIWTVSTLTPLGGVPGGTTGVVFSGVSCVSSSWCLGVGTYYAGVTVAFSEVWNGTAWGTVAYAGAPRLSGVSCVSSTQCRAVGSAGNQSILLVWGPTWVPQVLPTFTSANLLTGISCSAGTPCVAVGSFYGYGGASTLVEVMNVSLSSPGYRLVAADGGVFSFTAPYRGSMGGKPLVAPVVGMATDPMTGGYWLVAADGGIFSFTAPFYGSMGGRPLNQPIVGMAATPTDGGYWLVAADGGIFAFGTAAYRGSTGGQPLNAPIVGMAATPTGGGYWMVAADGGVFAFTAPFYGSRATPTDPTAGIVAPATGVSSDPTTGGYRLVTQRGSLGRPLVSVGQEADFGTLAGLALAQPVVAILDDPGTTGYWMVAADGGVFAFNAPYQGSTGGTRLVAPIVGGAAA